MWALGNEWNYNGLYVGKTEGECVELIKVAAAAIKEVDSTHPVVTVYGELPSEALIDELAIVDAWALNIYSQV